MRSVVFSILLVAIFLPISTLILFYTDEPGTYYGWPLTYFWLTLIFVGLGKISNKLRLTLPEYAIVTVVVNFLGGSRVMMWWTHTDNILRLIDFTWGTIPLGLRSYAAWDALVPEWMFPTEARSEIVGMILEGISPGQIFPWGAVVGSMMVYSAFNVLMMFISFAVVFGIIGQPWVETENLLFANALPTVTVAQMGLEEEPSIFKFKTKPSTRVFWIAFLIGCFFSLQPLLVELYPAITESGAGAALTESALYPAIASIRRH